MKKSLRILYKVLTTLLLVLLITAIAFPFFFRDRIDAAFKTAINERIEGEVDYGKIGLSLFKTFPDLDVTINDLRISGNTIIENQSDLFEAEAVSFGVDIMSLIRNQDSIEIKSFNLQKPVINVYITKSGDHNYQIYRPSTESNTTSSENSLTFDLENYVINDAVIRYIDQSSNLDIYINPMDHQGDLSYVNDHATWNSKTTSSQFSLAQKGIKYLNSAQVDWDAKMDIDLADRRYTFGKNTLKINHLLLSIIGYADQEDDGWKMDFTFDTAENNFKNFVSLLPNIYTKDFDKVRASGLLKLNGYLKGEYNPTKKRFPKYGLSFDVKDGVFQYPGKPVSFNDIQLTGTVNNQINIPGVDQVDIPTFQFVLNDKPFSGQLRLLDLTNQPNYTTELKGTIDLADVYDAYPMETIESLSGELKMDAKINGSADPDKLSDAQYTGTASMKDITMKAQDQPLLSIRSADADLKNDYIQINAIDGKVGETDFRGQAEIRQFLSAFATTEPMEIKAQLSGTTLNINEFVKEENPSDSTRLSTELTDDWRRRANFDINSQYDRVIYENYNIKDIDFTGQGTLESFDLKKMTGNIQDSPVNVSGRLDNIYDYTFGDGDLQGQLDFQSTTLVVENWMEEEADASAKGNSETVYTVVPERVDLNVNFKSEQVQYADLKLKNVKGKLSIEDQKIVVTDMTGKALGGGFKVDGLYGYDGSDAPDFNIKYDLSKFSFEKTFAQLESFKMIAPVGKYLDGVYNSNLILGGKLGDNYLPDFSQLTGSGFFETLHGSIRDFKPIQVASKKLNISSLDEINLDYTRNWFEVKDGFVELKPFDKTVEDIDMTIAGRHKILGDMNYVLRMNIPIEKFEKLGVPSTIRDNWNVLANKLGGAGINVPGMDQVIVDVFLKGKLSNPTVEFKIVNFKDKSTGDVAEELIEEVTEQIRDTVATIIEDTKEVIRDTITTVVTEVKDSITTRVEEEIDEVKDSIAARVEEEIKNRVDSTLQDTASAIIKDILGENADDEIDKIKDKLGGWNPFKK